MYIFVVRSHTRSLLAFIAVTVPLADTSNQTRSSRSTLFTFTCFKAFKCKKPKADIIVFWIVFISEIIMRQFWSLSNLLVSICIIAIATASNTFETISDDDLVEKIKSNEFFIALFCKWFWWLKWYNSVEYSLFRFSAKKNCADCEKYETELFKIRDELRENFPTEVSIVVDSQLVRLYSPKKEPAVVFFRHGVPLLIDGAINADEIYHQLDQNRMPAVKELTDDSFEHLTQAATGSTTGDWLILL